MKTISFSFDGVTYNVSEADCPPLDKEPLVSIVLTAYKRADQLANTLQSIEQQSYKNLQIIVVEDGRNGLMTEYMARLHKAEYICRVDRPDRSYSNCSIPLNMGLRQVRGDITIIQCAECEYTTTEAIKTLIEPILENPNVSTSAWVQAEDADGKPSWIHSESTHPHCFLNFCQAIATHNIKKIGGFDETFVDWGLEDNDFEFRLQYSGVKCMYAPVKVIHQWHEPAVKNEEDCRLASQYYKQKLKGIVDGTVPIKGNL